MKKAIFLVDDIKDGKVVTLLERIYEKLINKLSTEGYSFGWISETPRTLYNCPSDFITFRKASEFVDEVKNNGTIDKSVDIFYFISSWLHIKTFHLTDLFAVDPDVTDFLVKHRIPIIIDGSIEMDNIYTRSYNLFEFNYDDYLVTKNHFFRGIKDLKFIVVGGDLVNDYNKGMPRNIHVDHRMFPGAFFHKAYINSDLYLDSISKKEILFEEIRNRILTHDTLVWQSFCRTPRLTRTLFQLWADKEMISEYGQYSRLLPAKDSFLQDCKDTGISSKYQEKLSFISTEQLENLNTLKFIDHGYKNHLRKDITGVPFKINSMFHIVLETCPIISGEDFECTPSMLTEKTAMAILSGIPFITLGGHKNKNILKSLGFKEYPGLELPSFSQRNFFKELDFVIAKVKAIANLTLEEKQELYDSWKEIIMYNYERYLKLDTKKLYLEFLNQSR
jgi:hypothetical protein